MLENRSLHSCPSTNSVVDMHACQKILGVLGEQIGADYWVVCSLLTLILTTSSVLAPGLNLDYWVMCSLLALILTTE